MKKFLLLSILVALSINFTAHSQTTNNSENELEAVNKFEVFTDDAFRVTFEYTDGQENKALAQALVTKEIFESFGLTEERVLNMIRLSVTHAQNEFRYPRTFKLPIKSYAVYVDAQDDETINLLIDAIGSNAMGVEGIIQLVDVYDAEGRHIEVLWAGERN